MFSGGNMIIIKNLYYSSCILYLGSNMFNHKIVCDSLWGYLCIYDRLFHLCCAIFKNDITFCYKHRPIEEHEENNVISPLWYHMFIFMENAR